MRDHPTPLEQLTTVLMDVDGVLTDGFVLALEGQEPIRRMHIKDGFALQHAVKVGLRVGVISGGSSLGVRQRLERLGVTEIHLGASQKLPVYEQVKAAYGLIDREICYIGDDLPDATVLRRVGYAVAPSDAATDVLACVHRVTRLAGGQGCVREVLEEILKAKGLWYRPELDQW